MAIGPLKLEDSMYIELQEESAIRRSMKQQFHRRFLTALTPFSRHSKICGYSQKCLHKGTSKLRGNIVRCIARSVFAVSFVVPSTLVFQEFLSVPPLNSLFSVSLFSVSRWQLQTAQAQPTRRPPETSTPSKKQIGEISMQFEDDKTERSYKEMTADVIEKLKTFHSRISSSESLKTADSPLFDDEELYYLAAAHLDCSIRSGVCTLIPQALFEIDLVRNAITPKSGCKTLTPFWKHWVDADMERRVDLNIKVADLEKRAEFKRTQRPKYLKCMNTIETMLSEITDNQKYLRDRYSANNGKKDVPLKLAIYLETLNQKIPNIFISTKTRRVSAQGR